ncbi:glycosyltransferase family 4 protein [Jannaschia ovalis]|uniref:Glycosyltransferase family 4 protein n=1 Tax=Jannaschia ovalis TaxID=3038773 RepID=A0ABY8LEB5_9RHOB|nr:glycosyltransferase family 4 protein [Jannaschia sp. GRR-S6-38]WGH79641.1 glycosyltransferase family 4 protein [Jannaschia sp. GRR-S6-38]
MRIVFFQSGLGAGGAEKNIAAIATHRAALGDDVHIVSMTAPRGGAYFDVPDTVTTHVMPARGRVPLQLRRLRYVRRMMRTLAPDLVISFLTKINVLTLLAMPERRFPIIASERNNPRAQRNNRLWKHLNLFALGRADRIVMLTEAALAELPRTLRDRAEVIYVPCPPAAGARYANTGGKRVVAVGRLDGQKGFDLLIAAFAAVHRDHPDASLTIFGEGQERARLERMVAEAGLGAAVTLPGVTAARGAWIGEGDIFVFSSRHEGFGNALAEATAAGMPSISFDCEFGPAEIITHGETGLLVPPEDTDALARAISGLLADPAQQARLSAAARERNAKRFDPETILGQWDAVIASTTRRR